MFKKIFTIISGVFLSFYFLNSVQATPPRNLELDYDQTNKVLHVHLTHISTNVYDHYIRQIIVYKNDQSVKVLRLVKQNTGRELRQDIPIDAKLGDVLRIKAVCNQAGTLEATITVNDQNSMEKKVFKDQRISPTQADPSINQKKSGY